MIDDLKTSPLIIEPLNGRPIKAQRIVALFEGKVLQIKGKSPSYWYDEQSLSGSVSGTPLYLGYCNNTAIFAYHVDKTPNHAVFDLLPLRHCMMSSSETEASILNRAAQITHWYETHQFCGRCGSSTTFSQHELLLHCQGCGYDFYPKISPCIIVLVHRNNSELLLAHHVRYGSKKIYSTLAGFIEAGESAEDAAHREVAEEVGIKIKNLRYFSSQAWPFPNQLMLGYFAEYAEGDIQIDQEELIDARWWSIDALPNYAPNFSIAGQLIEHFVNEVKHQET